MNAVSTINKKHENRNLTSFYDCMALFNSNNADHERTKFRCCNDPRTFVQMELLSAHFLVGNEIWALA